MMKITDKEFNAIRSLVYDRFGINLTDQKRSLVVSRLQKTLREKGFFSFQDYLKYVISDRSEDALTRLIDQITTNHTYFYRESAHFEFFIQKALPEIAARLKNANTRDLRVWCAGCSTGEEAYMLVMLMLEFFKSDYGMWDAGILATDISSNALKTAIAGIYPEERVNHIPVTLRKRYLTDLKNGQWAIKEIVKKEVTFRSFNFMNKVFPFKKQFHIIFCRNVMIYFDKITRESLVARFHKVSTPGGYFFVGHSETLGRDQNLYQYLSPAVYQVIK